MKLLLDTYTFLWFIANRPELSQTAKDLLQDDGNDLFLSYASVWETAIKVSIGKLAFPEPFHSFISKHLSANDIEMLPFSLVQLSRVAELPFHHPDPFDRLLAAQSLTEDLPFLSVDEIFDYYGVKRLW